MKVRCGFLVAYRVLLRLYPRAFRQRFCEEMLEIAAVADASEWPLIVSDTAVAIVRSRITSPAAPSRAISQDEYLPVGEWPTKAARLFQGFALATALVLGACYVSTQTVWNLPSCHVDSSCPPIPVTNMR